MKDTKKQSNGGGEVAKQRPPAFARDYSFAYLHALAAVTLGSLFASAEGLTRGTLSAGIAKHVSKFRGRRALNLTCSSPYCILIEEELRRTLPCARFVETFECQLLSHDLSQR